MAAFPFANASLNRTSLTGICFMIAMRFWRSVSENAFESKPYTASPVVRRIFTNSANSARYSSVCGSGAAFGAFGSIGQDGAAPGRGDRDTDPDGPIGISTRPVYVRSRAMRTDGAAGSDGTPITGVVCGGTPVAGVSCGGTPIAGVACGGATSAAGGDCAVT